MFRSVYIASDENILDEGIVVIGVGSWRARRDLTINATCQSRVVFLDYSTHCHFMNEALPGVDRYWAGR